MDLNSINCERLEPNIQRLILSDPTIHNLLSIMNSFTKMYFKENTLDKNLKQLTDNITQGSNRSKFKTSQLPTVSPHTIVASHVMLSLILGKIILFGK